MRIQSSDTFELDVPNATVRGGQIFANLGTPVGTTVDVYAATSVDIDFPTDANTVLVDCSGGGDVSVTLPLGSAEILGHRYSIIKVDNGADSALLTPSGSDTIEGASALGAPTRYSRRDVVWAGDMWRRASTVLSSANFLTTTGNLIGIADPKIARQAIGANEHCLTGRITSVKATDADSSWISWPYLLAAGNAYVTDWSATLEGTTDDDVVLTLYVNGVATTPTLTIPAGVAGDTVHVSLLTNNQIPAGTGMQVVVSGDNTLAVPCAFTLKCIV